MYVMYLLVCTHTYSMIRMCVYVCMHVGLCVYARTYCMYVGMGVSM